MEEAPLTREQLALLLYRMKAGTPTGETSIADVSTVSPWALETVRWAVDTGTMTLDITGSFRPQDPVTVLDLG